MTFRNGRRSENQVIGIGPFVIWVGDKTACDESPLPTEYPKWRFVGTELSDAEDSGCFDNEVNAESLWGQYSLD
jgi:hypothetical protein